MNILNKKKCSDQDGGTDLNRNYAFHWGEGTKANDIECEGDTFRGKEPFSEPETQAIRDFIISKKDELNFVYNFHSAGQQYIIPYNGMMPNILEKEHPDVWQIFHEIVQKATFPENTEIGSSGDTLGIVAGGSSGDWIVHNFDIPAAEFEIGQWGNFHEYWQPKNTVVCQQMLDENMGWLEHTYNKLGNQVQIEAIGYKKVDPKLNKYKDQGFKALFYLNITNNGLSDQIHDDYKVMIKNQQFQIPLTHNGGLYQKFSLGRQFFSQPNYDAMSPEYFINNMKKRSSQVVEIPVWLSSPKNLHNFYDTYDGPIETSIEFAEFTSSTRVKNDILKFDMMK